MKHADMLKIAAVLGAVSVFAPAGAWAADAMSDDQCKALWTMASPHGDTISKDQATPYVVNFTMVDSDNDGTIDADEFQKGCKAGQVKAADQGTMKDMGH